MEINPVGKKAAAHGEEASLGERPIEAVVVNPCNESISVGGRLMKLKRAWKFKQWAFSIVSKGLGWQWLRVTPPVKYNILVLVPPAYLGSGNMSFVY